MLKICKDFVQSGLSKQVQMERPMICTVKGVLYAILFVLITLIYDPGFLLN